MLRKVTKEECEFYENVVYPLQDKILSYIHSDKLYLTGGTCLSRFYYQHRYSEDLDFFFDGYKYHKEEFNSSFILLLHQIKKLFPDTHNKVGVEVLMDDDLFKRIIIHSDIKLKIEFVLELTQRIGELKKINNFFVDSKINIAVNKITTLYGRRTVKDYVDLYFLLHDFTLQELIPLVYTKMLPLDYEGLIMALHNGPLEGEAIMIKELNENILVEFIKNFQTQLLEYARNVS